ncbi:MAG: YceI family protein [Flavobacteriales bacterium]|nr:YceI family protein [Flavobacteriales bacterium]
MKTIITLALISISVVCTAQGKFFTRNGTITFFSSTPVEDIKAENYNATAVLDAATGAMEFSLLMKSFNFKKALMQEHFNENYVESDKFPKATFKGTIVNLDEIDFGKDGSYPATVKGDLTIHGETKPVETTGTIDVKDGKVITASSFMVAPEDYKIEIPGVVRDKIAKKIEVSVNTELEPLNR